MIDKRNWGVLYFLTVKGNVDIEKRTIKVHGGLLERSVKSLKKHMPDIGTILFTDIDSVDWYKKGFDVVAHKQSTSGDVWTYKYQCLLETPFERTIHMDCDTYVCEPFYEVFEMLDGIHFAVPFSPWYLNFTSKQFHVPVSFPEPAGGFMAYRTDKATFNMLGETKRLVENRDGGCDEPYLRLALYESKVRFCFLPWEYNCVFFMPGFLLREAKVLHGKYYGDIGPVARSFSAKCPKIFTGEKIIYCEKLKGHRKAYRMGLVENCGHNKVEKRK